MYDTPHMIMDEFKRDVKRFYYVKRLLKKYHKGIEFNIQLILNHLIIIFNVFGPEASIRTLFFKIAEENWTYLIPCLLFLNMCPSKVYGINGKDIIISDYPLNTKIITELRKI